MTPPSVMNVKTGSSFMRNVVRVYPVQPIDIVHNQTRSADGYITDVETAGRQYGFLGNNRRIIVEAEISARDPIAAKRCKEDGAEPSSERRVLTQWRR
jgi:hypothetical protein